MRKGMVVLVVVGLLCVWVSPLMAGGIINKSNMSADYFRSLTRNAATDAADIVAYNPAGVMKMPNGLYIKGDAMYITKDYSNNTSDINPYFSGEDGDFESDEPSVVPGLFAVYKKDKWAGFFAVTVPAGGGEVKYDEGSAFTSLLGLQFWALSDLTPPIGDGTGPWGYTGIGSANLEGNSFAVGYTLGGAYEINKMFSLAGGVRYVSSHKEFKGSIRLNTIAMTTVDYSLDLEQNATGFNYFLGVNVAPTDKLNLGLLYVSNTSLEYESDVSEDTSPGAAITNQVGWGDGTKFNEDIPAILGLGISYQITPKLRTEFNHTLYLEKAAELDSKSGRFDNAGNSSDTALSFEYAFNPQWKASLGYMITRINGMDPEQLLPPAPELDANTIAIGAVYSPNDRWRFNAGLTNVDYAEVTTDTTGSNSPAGTEFDKHSTSISVGIQYRFF
jgi:long-chain fatty acid transport protein